MNEDAPLLVIVDAANVVGSVPDGWWRDRAGATVRLRDKIAGLSAEGLPGKDVPAWAEHGPLDVVLIAEGKARGIGGSDTVTVSDAPGSGDDAIVALVAGQAHRNTLVITADRALRDRVHALGAHTTGPRCIHRPGGG